MAILDHTQENLILLLMEVPVIAVVAPHLIANPKKFPEVAISVVELLT